MRDGSRCRSGLILVALAVLAPTARSATAQETMTWENSTELSFVATGVPLLDVGGAQTGTMVTTVSDKVDRILTLTLVIKL